MNDDGMDDNTINKEKLLFLQKELLSLMEGCAKFPYPQICRHLVGLDILSLYSQVFPDANSDTLAAAFVTSDDTGALEILTKMQRKT